MAKQGEKKTKIFIRDATNIDCALLMPEQAPVGKSWSVDIVWTGYTNNEGIIFDFSLARKAAKKTIDTFFDHKLYVRQKVISRMPGKRSLICEQCRDLNGRYFILDTCNEAIALFEEEVFREIQLSDSPTLLEAIIADAVLKESPENVTEVAVELREHTHKFRGNYFSYTHSLNRHYGNCQRFHGHSNIIEVFSGNQLDYGESEKAAQLLNNKYIINRGHLREIQKSKRLSAIPNVILLSGMVLIILWNMTVPMALLHWLYPGSWGW